MEVEQAIKKAIEGGWKKGFDIRFEYRCVLTDEPNSEGAIQYEEIFLDPSFWQSVGKSMGWDAADQQQWANNNGRKWFLAVKAPYWLFQMLQFTRHLAEGKTAESFFAELTGLTSA